MTGKALLVKAISLIMTAAVAGAVAFLALRTAGAEPVTAQAWIDDPLDGSVVAPAPLGIIAHAYDPAGVEELALLVDGVPAQVVRPARAGERLVWVQLSWVPPGTGSYLLTVVGRGAGRDGVPGEAFVVVSAGPPAARTPTSEPTPTTSATPPGNPPPPSVPPPPPPPPPPCNPPAPIPLQPADGATFHSPGPHAPQFTWSAWRGVPPDCPASGFRIEITFGRTVVGGDTAASVTSWQPAPLPCGSQFSWRVGAKRGDGTLAAWSPARTFVIICIPS